MVAAADARALGSTHGDRGAGGAAVPGMTDEHNPQAEQMAHESMVRNLAAQANAIWPQEEPLFARYRLAGELRIADVGCGSGEITSRLARLYPRAQVVGIDILESAVTYARSHYARLAPRVRFEQGDAFELRLPANGFDLVVCRHLTQAVPDPERVLAELHRICRPGGFIHVLSEDYGLIAMMMGRLDPDRLFKEGVIPYTHATGTDARVGRRTWSMMKRLGIVDLCVDYAVVDTVRVERTTFAAILAAWRDGYSEVINKKTTLRPGEARALFDQIVDGILDPEQYAVWHVPIVSGRKPNP
jgi:2-polyprenyl-3-methyl-5-hydroxy-6-metoxy-1,4-benzoquinol methylase